jgi:hypothetical protein
VCLTLQQSLPRMIICCAYETRDPCASGSQLHAPQKLSHALKHLARYNTALVTFTGHPVVVGPWMIALYYIITSTSLRLTTWVKCDHTSVHCRTSIDRAVLSKADMVREFQQRRGATCKLRSSLRESNPSNRSYPMASDSIRSNPNIISLFSRTVTKPIKYKGLIDLLTCAALASKPRDSF